MAIESTEIGERFGLSSSRWGGNSTIVILGSHQSFIKHVCGLSSNQTLSVSAVHVAIFLRSFSGFLKNGAFSPDPRRHSADVFFGTILHEVEVVVDDSEAS